MSENVEGIIQDIVTRFKGDNCKIHGRNINIEVYKSLWLGKPNWLAYNIYMPDNTIHHADMMSINCPRLITRIWANNYANENTLITITGEEANERLKIILQNNGFFGKFNNFVEEFMGLGIGCITERCNDWKINESTGNIVKGDEIKIQFVRGDRVYPIFVEDGIVKEVALVSYNTNGIKVTAYILNSYKQYDIIEMEANGRNGAYDLNMQTLKLLHTNTDIPFFQIWMPNITDDDESQIGTSITSKAVDVFHQLDMIYTNYYKEIDLGKKIKYMKESQVYDYDANGNQIPRHLNLNDESVILTQGGVNDEDDMKTFQDDLRVEKFNLAMNQHLNLASMLCGLGQSTFEFGEGGRIQTATGVIAKNTELYRNIIKQENYATAQFKAMVKALAYINDNFLSGVKFGDLKETDIKITYDDNIMEDTQAKMDQAIKEVQAGVMSVAEYRADFYDEDIETATATCQSNGLLAKQYYELLVAGAMTPEQYVNLVYGEKVNDKDKIIAYITSKLSTPSLSDMNYDGGDDTSDEDEEEEIKEGAE